MSQTIGFLGAGRMASAMIARSLEQGYRVQVWNRSPGKTEPLVALGATACSTPADAVSNVDIVISFMADDTGSEAVWLGDNGALAAMKPGTLAVECSTLSHGFVLDLAAKITAAGYDYIDAPVTGVPADIQAGNTVFLIGADETVLDRAWPFMNAVGKRIVHFGPIGSGTVYKLMHNLLGAVHIAAAAELVAVAQKAGLDGDVVAETFATGANASMSGKMTLPGMISGNHHEGIHFTTGLRAKDAAYAMQLATDMNMSLPVGQAASDAFKKATADGLGDLAQSAVIETVKNNK
ncbi:NAD(P)-dependent oxidoreductase [Thalassospira lucentensis]|uniref:NAD(P)-dependent oxidoreductase n=1 Tax=Thalassospira lucentensis TaxID=168935 RepID=UPI00142E627F|nr:NAD(P)-dependent oxidoreductase [Thalassospira lucentensis]NIZ02584.1 NAD(P)-dependent oxidoreductase [Thalassospira lucentensis]